VLTCKVSEDERSLSVVKKNITHEYKDGADEVSQDSQLEEKSGSGESLFTA